MKEQMMKKLRSKRTRLIVFSFLIAILLWSYVRREKDIEITKVFRGVSVRYVDVSELKVNGLTILSPETASVDIKVTGNLSKMNNLTNEDISAVCNLKGYSSGDYKIKVDARVSEPGVRITSVEPKSLNFKIDERVSHEFEVNVKTVGVPSHGMILDDFSNSQKVLVEGPKTYVDSIDKLVAVVNLDGISDSKLVSAKVSAFNENDEEVEKINIIPERINVDIPLLKTQTLPIKLKTYGKPNVDAVVKYLAVTPNAVRVKGNATLIDKITEIETKEININDILSDKVKTVELNLPQGVSLLDDESTFAVSYKLGSPNSMTVDVPVGNIEFKNVPKGYRIQTMDSLKFIQVEVEPINLKDQLQVDPNSIKITCDLEKSKVLRQKLKFKIEVPERFVFLFATPETIEIGLIKN
ncbi:hypothetical protein LV469_02490 [Peptoniphilus sp. GNH]|nr:YbbR-like protein [Clostridiales bacterium KA00134]UHR03175.1 hypothetical protein LV469_02490 [Peptoniphilus sp. GNH]